MIGLLLSAMGGRCGGHSPITESRPSPGFRQPEDLASQRASDLTIDAHDDILNRLEHLAGARQYVRETYWGRIGEF